MTAMKLTSWVKTLIVALVGIGLATAAIPNALCSGGPGGAGGGGGASGGGGGGGAGGGSGLSAILNVLRGPWESLIGTEVVTMTFNNNGTFTVTIDAPSGAIKTDAGTWTLTPTSPPEPFANPQGHLLLVDTQGVVFLAGDVLLLKQDQLVMLNAVGSVTGVPQIGELILTKMTP